MAELQAAFEAFASFGTSAQTEMDNSHFSKMLKECKIVDKSYTSTDVDLLFNKIKSKGARKITFSQFRDLAVADIAGRKKVAPESIIATIQSSSPQAHATRPDAVKFHDDKSQYTGVYKAGGPTNIDRDSGNLSGIVDRRVGADVRGSTTSQKDQRSG